MFIVPNKGEHVIDAVGNSKNDTRTATEQINSDTALMCMRFLYILFHLWLFFLNISRIWTIFRSIIIKVRKCRYFDKFWKISKNNFKFKFFVVYENRYIFSIISSSFLCSIRYNLVRSVTKWVQTVFIVIGSWRQWTIFAVESYADKKHKRLQNLKKVDVTQNDSREKREPNSTNWTRK